jgi:hypothetical protein
MTPTVTLGYESIKIHFGEVLHLHLSRPIFAMQSWVQEREGKYTIQYTTAGGDVTSEYDDKEKWKAILSGMDKLL